MRVLGVSGLYHDSAACLVEGGRVVAAAQEERFSRVKHDARLPRGAVAWCLEAGGGGAIDAVAFYEKPLLKLHRILETALAVAPRGLGPFLRAVPLWLRDRVWVRLRLRELLAASGVPESVPIFFVEHHESHAASAFFPSPFDEATTLTVDGVGEWACASVGRGRGGELELLAEQRFPHSLGLAYSAFTAYLGFRVNDGEYKVMGLAPYGEPRFVDAILRDLVRIEADGSLRLGLEHFGFTDELRMFGDGFARVLGGPPRAPGDALDQRHADVARSIQEVTERAVLAMARSAVARTGCPDLCLAGGVALNCVANGRLLREGVARRLWIQPAAGDAGGAIGAALAASHGALGVARPALDGAFDGMRGALLGPAWSDDAIRSVLVSAGAAFDRPADGEWAPVVAERLAQGEVVALFDGPMEFGPRALGNRSILADPRDPRMQAHINQRIKEREGFRPFAPVVLEERAPAWFDLDVASPYMLLTAPVRTGPEARLGRVPGEPWSLEAMLAAPRPPLPAVTHVDGSARVQTVGPGDSRRIRSLLVAWERLTGCPALVNTSFNGRDEPIVCSPADAYACFVATGIDTLSIGPYLVRRPEAAAP
jgi:carbamoyltransferase